MKYLILIINMLFLCTSGKAHTIQGKIQGLQEGSVVYLMTHPDNTIEQKWSLRQIVDSCTVKDQGFRFVVPNANYGRIWLVKTSQSPLVYYFNKNEDISLEGTVGNFGLSGQKFTGGRDRILMEDIFSILDEYPVTPFKRSEGVDWLTRHISEDIAIFATAYFYLENKVLRAKDIRHLLKCIPSSQQANPYYKLISDFYHRDTLLQPGKPLPTYTLVKSSGEQIKRQHTGHPQIIFHCDAPNLGDYYLDRVKEFTTLQQTIPNLELILIYPKFPEEIIEQLEPITTQSSIFTADYQKTVSANPELFYNHYASENLFFVDSEGKILAVSPETDNYEKIFTETPQADGYTINGYVLGMDEGIVELVLSQKGTLSRPVIVDSTSLEKGFFTFKGKVPYAQYCQIGIRGTHLPIGFYLENSTIDVNIKIESSIQKRKGEKVSIKALRGKVYGSQAQLEQEYLRQLYEPAAIEKWISTHPDNMPALMNLAMNWPNSYSPDLIEKWLNMMDKSLSNHIAYQETLKQIAKHRELAIGNQAPDFTLPSNQGEKIALKKFRGKYVLLDFWASWCGPCRMEIPNLKKAWNRYHSKGLEIVSITTDRKEQDWRKALAEEKMPWTQLTAQGTKVSELYNVEGIPHIVLIDPKGRITEVNMRGKKLEEKLEELFHP